MKTYLKIRWIHEDPQYPVFLLSELDESRFETRKVEIYADGRMGCASEELEVGNARLGEVPLPSETEIAADPQFVVESLMASDFEQFWVDATSR